jgi:hypothetical protein
MPIYHLLVFDGPKLEAAETFEADGHMDAVKHCSSRNRYKREEVWAQGHRIAVLQPLLGPHQDDPAES